MKKAKIYRVLFTAAGIIFLLSGCAVEGSAAHKCGSEEEKSLQQYLPQGEIDGWKRNFSPMEFEGEDLYLYINGGAEIYHEFGFKRVLVQDYKNEYEKSISLEIYEMTDPESAFGIYTFKRGDSGEVLKIGSEGSLEDYYLNFWKGKFLITLTGFDSDKETILGLKKIAQGVNDLLPDSGKAPHLVKLFPDIGLEKKRIKYFKGHLALFNSYPFFKEDVFSLKRGVRGDYSAGFSLFIFQYPDDEESRRIYDEALKKFKHSDRYKDFLSESDDKFSVFTIEGKRLSVECWQSCILILLGDFTVQDNKDIMERFKAKIKRSESGINLNSNKDIKGDESNI